MLPTAWAAGSPDILDWKTLVKISRPGWWLVTVWLYLAPTGGHYEVLPTLNFWLGLAYVLFPLNLLVYGLNDYTDVDLDAGNKRKGNFLYGAKCTSAQVRTLPQAIVILNVAGILCLACRTGEWMTLALWLVICFAVNMAYNFEPVRLSSNGPWELPCVVCGFAGVTWLSSIVNGVPASPMGYWAHMTCLVLRTQLWTEMLDYEPDLACGRRTTSTLIGKRASKAAVLGLLLLEAAVTWGFFFDTVMRVFAVISVVSFIGLELMREIDDSERKKVMKSQSAIGLSLVLWIWYKGLFAAF